MNNELTQKKTVAAPSLLSFIDNGLNDDEIRKKLFDTYQDDYHVMNLMAEVKRLRNSKKTSAGLVLLLIGAVLLLMSCILTLTGTYTAGSFGMVLFGLTTVGVTIVFIGLVKIFS